MAQLSNLIVNGVSRFLNDLYGNLVGTINGFTIGKSVPSDALFTDTQSTWYCTCTTAAATQAKVATTSGSGFSLFAGVMIAVKFTNTNSYSSTAAAPVTLNVNSTGAKPIWGANTASPTGTNTLYYGVANYINYYIYDGTYWVWAGRSTENNSTYAGYSFGLGYGTCSTAYSTVAKACDISGYNLHNGGVVCIQFIYDVPASATLNIRTRGAKPIYYRGAAITEGVIKAGDIATFMYYNNYYYLIAIDRNIEIATVAETRTYLGIS